MKASFLGNSIRHIDPCHSLAEIGFRMEIFWAVCVAFLFHDLIFFLTNLFQPLMAYRDFLVRKNIFSRRQFLRTFDSNRSTR